MTRIALSALLVAALLVAPPPAAALADPVPEGAVVDQFDGDTLGQDWTVLSPDESRWSLSDGALHLDTLTGDTHQGTNNARNLFLVDVPDGDFEVVTRLSAPVSLDYQSAGLLAWQDWDNYVRAGLAHVGFAGGPVIETATEVGAAFTSAFAARPGSTAETLKLARSGDEFTSSYWDGTAWVQASRMTARLEVRQLGLFGLSAQNGQTSQGAWFDRMWQFAHDQKADLVDEHYYNNPDWFLANNHRYDTFDILPLVNKGDSDRRRSVFLLHRRPPAREEDSR
ncbi:Extracellular exo-alpha-L-arabinofuranosidase precursor [Nonomuraea coxensis DSM 45129]|uniref:Extracellular exo-alpha-L-arabinofuranosidase n=1 Tax=Nonomuraea coxensis DSM 45129 TaxID=1122611 RepID=A0ABX8UAR9_9ACTN|nr:Extracellular exo-alpha-L-arabinofuranosidase precursor [Nonomuraea coxensis DSM 45129]